MTAPQTAADYLPDWSARVQATCLYVATRLGDLVQDLVIVGGYAPQLMIPQDELPEGGEKHVGTVDLDLGLAIGILNAERYREIAARLRDAGFQPDRNDKGNVTRQRWVIEDGGERCTVDFLISPPTGEARVGTIQGLEPDFGALVVRGLHLAFRDRMKVTLSGKTIRGEKATRDVYVCGPGAFTVLKALSFRDRGKDKDAYDLFYVVTHFRDGPADIGRIVRELTDDPATQDAIAILEEDFRELESLGPMRVAAFLGDQADEAIRTDVVGAIAELIRNCRT